MAQPIVKYTLNNKGQVPEWINTSDSSFAGQHGITGNKTGYIPKYESPQNTIFLGIASGDPDPDGTPDDYVGIITTKALLQTYITETGSTLKYKTTTLTLTGIQTATTGLSTAWGQTEYSGGLSTSTTSKHTVSGVGTVAKISTSQITKVVTVVDRPTGSSISTVSTPVVVDPASTLSGVSTSVGIVTTTGTVTGIQTATTTGLSTAWNQENYSGGLSTTTSTKYTASGVGTVATISTSAVTKVVVATDTTTGSTDATTDTPIVIDAASTLSGVSTSSSVGVVTTTDTAGLAVTTTTTTYTTSFTYTDVVTNLSTSTSSITTDGVTTRTDTVTTTETTNYETSYDYAAEATRLWDIYTALNS